MTRFNKAIIIFIFFINPILAIEDNYNLKNVYIGVFNNKIDQVFDFKEATISVWNAEDGQQISEFKQAHTGKIEKIAFSPDGKYIVSASQDKTLKLWDIVTKSVSQTFSGHAQSVNTVSFSSDGKYIVSGGDDNSTKIWDVSDGSNTKTFKGHNSVNAVAFSPDGKYVASGGYDSLVRIWDVESGSNTKTFSKHSRSINTVVFSPNGKYIASGDNNVIELWDIDKNETIDTISWREVSIKPPLPNLPNQNIANISFSPDGKYIVFTRGYTQPIVRVWEIASKTIIKTFTVHANNAVFLPNNTQIVSVLNSGDSVYLLDVNKSTELKTTDIDNKDNYYPSAIFVSTRAEAVMSAPAFPNINKMYSIDPNTFSNLEQGIHLMGTSRDINDSSIFKYVDDVLVHDKATNTYVPIDLDTKTPINIKAHSGIFIHNETADDVNITKFSIKASTCSPPTPRSFSLRSTSVCTIGQYLKTITSGWNLLGTSEEITNTSAVFDSTYQVYAVGANKTTFENIKDMNRTIKANSGFWVYKGSEQLLP